MLDWGDLDLSQLLGIQIEQMLVYSLTTVLVISTLHLLLVITYAFYEPNRGKGNWVTFTQEMVVNDGVVDGVAPPLPLAASMYTKVRMNGSQSTTDVSTNQGIQIYLH